MLDHAVPVAYTVLEHHSVTEVDVLRLRKDIKKLLGDHGATVADFDRRAGVARSTIHALINPRQHPERVGGMHPITASKLARAYASATGTDEEPRVYDVIQ